ncbi:MAG: DegV family protein [Clostridia bacterium]|nr:DegV family protein [Clostridia bacterium]
MKIKVTVDSTNDLTPELIEKYDITVMPLAVNMGDKLYRDMVDISPDDIYAHVNAGGALPKTSAVNAAEYGEMFEKYLKDYDAIIHINISSEMSTCHNSARMAAEGLPVYPIDSRNLSTGSALLALMACEKAAAGEDAEKIAEDLRAAVDKVDASFVVSRLDYLHKGGRCSAIAMLGANVLKLKPCIEVHDGKMGVAKKYRGNYGRCLDMYVKDRLTADANIDTSRIFITHSGVDQAIIDQVRATVEGCMKFDEILVTRAGCTISSHCGDGTLGILYMHR